MVAKNEAPVTTATRLPNTVVPEHYKLKLTPDIANGTFTGQVSITVEVHEPVSRIDLNAAGLKVTSAVIYDADGTTFPGKATHNEDAHRVSIDFDGTVGRGKRILDLTFDGILDPKLRGFYKSTYKDADGKQQAIAVTKFEPSDARRAFPCWDEPAFKAVFEIALEVDEELTAISNASIVSEVPAGNGKKLVSFAPSIKMSSYLAAWVVGKFESSEPVKSGDCEIRVWSVPGKKHMHAFALEIAKYSLDYLAEYFNLAYPSNKLDLIAIPDFASGAMENFGCVTYRETALLVDPATASLAEFKRVANVVSHENAHMWFGDYTTMTWWNGLWLNEAAATYLAIKVLADFRPEWNVWDEFNIDKAPAFKVDGLHSTRSIEFPVGTPEQARAMFDVLTYEKGCAVLRMLELYLGGDIFRNGMRNYLRSAPFGNADTPDLWKAIEDAAKEAGSTVPVSALMHGWVFQPGYPVVTVSRSETGSITVKQKRFTYLADEKATSGLWHIPLTIRALTTGGIVEKKTSLQNESATIFIGDALLSVVVNVDGQGFYRVNYSGDLRDALLRTPKQLTVSERFNLIADMWANVLSGDVSLSDFFAAVKKLCVEFQENDPHVWSVVTGSFGYLRRMLPHGDQTAAAALLKSAREVITPKLDKLGLEPVAGEDSAVGELRGSLASTMALLGDEAVRTKMTELFARYSADRKSVDANLVPAVIDGTASGGNNETYDAFCALRKSASTPQEEARFLFALTTFKDEQLADRTLQGVLTGDVRTQDAPSVLMKLFGNPAASRKTWEFVKANWDKLVTLMPLQGMIRIAEGVSMLVDPALEDDVNDFFGKHTPAGSEKAVAQTREQLRIAYRMQTREQAVLAGK